MQKNKKGKKMQQQCTKNAKPMQSKSKTNAIKNVLVFAFAFFLLCICVLFVDFFLHFLCVSLRKRKNIAKHNAQNNAQKMKNCNKIEQKMKTTCKKIEQTKVVCEIWLCMCIFFLHLFYFFELLFCFFWLFFWLPFAFFFAF